MLMDLKDRTYSNRDHGITGFEFDPQFPSQPYAYSLYHAQPGFRFGFCLMSLSCT